MSDSTSARVARPWLIPLCIGGNIVEAPMDSQGGSAETGEQDAADAERDQPGPCDPGAC